jgi:hypothetical protein
MKVATIVPLNMLDLVRKDTYHLVLAPLCANVQYLDFYRKHQRGHKILDNGVYEGANLTDRELLTIAIKVGATEVVAPDVLDDMEATVDRLHRFMSLADPNMFKIMVLLHAKTWVEFKYILSVALEVPNVSIGLPKRAALYFGPDARITEAEIVRQVSPEVPIHAFGCTDNILEAAGLAQQGFVRGIDSADPVVRGLHKQGLLGLPIAHRPPDYFETGWEITEEVIRNIDNFREVCQATRVSEV